MGTSCGRRLICIMLHKKGDLVRLLVANIVPSLLFTISSVACLTDVFRADDKVTRHFNIVVDRSAIADGQMAVLDWVVDGFPNALGKWLSKYAEIEELLSNGVLT